MSRSANGPGKASGAGRHWKNARFVLVNSVGGSKHFELTAQTTSANADLIFIPGCVPLIKVVPRIARFANQT